MVLENLSKISISIMIIKNPFGLSKKLRIKI